MTSAHPLSIWDLLIVGNGHSMTPSSFVKAFAVQLLVGNVTKPKVFASFNVMTRVNLGSFNE